MAGSIESDEASDTVSDAFDVRVDLSKLSKRNSGQSSKGMSKSSSLW